MTIEIPVLERLLSARASPRVRLALLFGSQADGSARPDSDIDLALLCDRPLSGEERSALVADVGRTFGRAVDLVDLHRAPYPVTGEALGGRRVIDDGTAYAELAAKHLADREDFGPLVDRMLNERLDAWLRT